MDATRQKVGAYHEAGHAVVAHALGLTVSYIEVNSDGSGECRIPIPGPVIAEAAVYAGGALAEWLKFGIKAQPSPSDIKGLHRVPPQEQAKAIDRAERILRDHWADVEALAKRLLDDPEGFVPLPFAIDYRANP